MAMVNKVSFRNVADKGKEMEMYGPLVRVLRSVMKNDTHWPRERFLHTFAGTTCFLSTPLVPLTWTVQLFWAGPISPVIRSLPRQAPALPSACDMETFIELKNQEIDEPYCNDINEPFEHDTKDSRDARGQLAAYFNAIHVTDNLPNRTT